MKKYIRAHCDNCEKQVIAEKEIENSRLHIALIFLTMGLWGIVFLMIVKNKKYNCRICKKNI